MFSGLIQYQGEIAQKKKSSINVQVPSMKTKLGDSIAVNGICLTVTKQKKVGRKLDLEFDVSEETLIKTTLGGWKIGQIVNIEPSLKLSDLMGGHMVQGHVDGVGKLVKVVDQTSSREIWFKGPKEILKYIVPKGSITVNGVSLTAVKVTKKGFSVALIPVTWKHTDLGQLKPGDSVNLEADIIAKYVERYVKK